MSNKSFWDWVKATKQFLDINKQFLDALTEQYPDFASDSRVCMVTATNQSLIDKIQAWEDEDFLKAEKLLSDPAWHEKVRALFGGSQQPIGSQKPVKKPVATSEG